MYLDQLIMTAKTLMAGNKGLLAMDESTTSLHRRFEKAGIPQTFEARRAYRELIVTTPGIAECLSGAILVEETVNESTEHQVGFLSILNNLGIMPGIKVDEGTMDLAGFQGEKVTIGLDHLRDRLTAYVKLGLKFAKWRAVITIGKDKPSEGAVQANMHELARYAALCQEAGILPIVEPEVLMDGDHDIGRCLEVTKHVQQELFRQMSLQQVHLRCMILKPNMVISGVDATKQASVAEVARATVECLLEAVPAIVPGIAFLSGGQTPERATAHLNEIHKQNTSLPWPVTFSYSRAIQQPAMEKWGGHKENVEAAQELLFKRMQLLTLARRGVYSTNLENDGPWEGVETR
ncbi:MAG TPA: class I fructose-bisphosphate aldolase [Puia sp.]|jgi:fructose-bisphosphate aldolase class I